MIQLTSFELSPSAVQDCVFCTALEVSEFIRNSTYWKLPYFFVAYVISKHLQDSLGRKKKSSESNISSLQSSHEQKYLPSFPEHSKSNQYIIFTLTEKEKKEPLHYFCSYIPVGLSRAFQIIFFSSGGQKLQSNTFVVFEHTVIQCEVSQLAQLNCCNSPLPPMCLCIYTHNGHIDTISKACNGFYIQEMLDGHHYNHLPQL